MGPAQRSIYLRPRIVKAWTAAEETVVTGNMTDGDATWPELPLSAWKDTYATSGILWTQIVGKDPLCADALAQIIHGTWCSTSRRAG